MRASKILIFSLFVLSFLAVGSGATAQTTPVESQEESAEVLQHQELNFAGEFPMGTRIPAGARVSITEDVYVTGRDTLVIEEGVEIKLAGNATFYIEGILLARGTAENPIKFSRLNVDEAWCRILFSMSSKAEVDENKAYVSGSILEFAEISGGGAARGAYSEGQLMVSGAWPYLSHLKVFDGFSNNGGGLAFVNGARSVVRDCQIYNNESQGNGGGIYVSMNSAIIFCNNFVVNNKAKRDGGGLYVSFSPAVIKGNVFEKNNCSRDGGALSINGSTPEINENVFRHNVSGSEGDNIVCRSGDPVFHKNSFITGDKTAIVTQSSSGAEINRLQGQNNYWGTNETYLLDRKRVDQIQDPYRPLVVIDPYLEAPPDEAPLHINDIESFKLYEDETYSVELQTDYIGYLSFTSLEATGMGRSDLVKEWVLVDVAASDGDKIRAILSETDVNSNVFRGQILVDNRRQPDRATIGTNLGAELTLTPVGFDSLSITLPVSSQQPFVRDLVMLNIPDLTHVIDDMPKLEWDYFEPRNRFQTSYKVTVLDEAGAEYWSSGVINSQAHKAQYKGPAFTRGKNFVIEVQANNNVAWSEPGQVSFRRNSVPSAPSMVLPAMDVVLTTRTPLFEMTTNPDNEADTLWATFDIVDEDDNTSVILSSNPVLVSGSDNMSIGDTTQNQMPSTQKASWTATNELEDNNIYLVRARTTDRLEVSDNSEWQRFIVNMVNDTPAEFVTEFPGTDGELLPGDDISWSRPYDPDPEDSLWYTVHFGTATAQTMNQNFTVSEMTDINTLEDDKPYSLIIKARDRFNAEVITGDSLFLVYFNSENDTPSVPVGFNLSDSQRVNEYPANLEWDLSSDIDHSDTPATISYEIELVREDGTPISILRTEPGATKMALSPVPDNSRAVWKVRALDNESLASNWSASGILEVNIKDEAPLEFRLLEPKYAATPYSLGPTKFTWEATRDVDPLNTVSYVFYLSSSEEFIPESSMIAEIPTEETSVVFEEELEHLKDYYWRVIAVDNTGLGTFSETYRFKVISTPSIPEWVAEMPFEITPEFKVKWKASTDPDPRDEIEYRVEVSDNTDFNGNIAFLDNITSTEINLNDIPDLEYVVDDDAKIFIRIKSRDDQGFESKWGNVVSAWINFENDIPMIPVAKTPSQVRLTDSRPTFVWNESKDNDNTDPTSSLKYVIKVSLADNVGVAVPGGSATLKAKLQWRPEEDLPDNSKLVWQVQAIDDEGAASEFCDPVNFSIDRKQEKPEKFDLTYPMDKGNVNPNSSITFKWTEAVDYDLDASVTYTVTIEDQVYGPFSETEFTLDAGLAVGKYKWRVEAKDNDNLTTNSKSFSLIVGQP